MVDTDTYDYVHNKDNPDPIWIELNVIEGSEHDKPEGQLHPIDRNNTSHDNNLYPKAFNGIKNVDGFKKHDVTEANN